MNKFPFQHALQLKHEWPISNLKTINKYEHSFVTNLSIFLIFFFYFLFFTGPALVAVFS